MGSIDPLRLSIVLKQFKTCQLLSSPACSKAMTRKATHPVTLMLPLNKRGFFRPRHTLTTMPSSTPPLAFELGNWNKTTFPGLSYRMVFLQKRIQMHGSNCTTNAEKTSA